MFVERDEQDIEAKVRELMRPYSEHLEVVPYKEYLEAKYAEWAAAKHGLPLSEFQSIAEVLSARLKEDVYFDENGVFCWSTLNPNRKYDGFRIGGSFDGDIWGKEQHFNLTPAEYKARYGMDVVRVEDNVRPAAELRPDLLPYAVITPDGQWRDREGKGDAEWSAEWAALLRIYFGHLAVGVDCHC